MKSSVIIVLLSSILFFLSCSGATNTPETAMNHYFDCLKKKDADCVMSFLGDGETQQFGKTPLERKKNLESFLSKIKSHSHNIDKKAINASTAEFEVTEKVSMETSNFVWNNVYTWVKSSDGSWKLDEKKSKQD